MRDVGIFEYEKHPFFLYYLSQIANTERNRVTVFATESMHERIRPLYTDEEYVSIRWIVEEADPIDAYFDRAERIASEELDVLWISTAWGTGLTPAEYLEFDPDCPSIVGITNLNDWTYNPFPDAIYGGVRQLTRLFRHAPRSVSVPIFQHLRYLMQPGILANHDAVNLEYPPMKRFAERHGDWGLDLYNLIPVLYEESKLPAVDDHDGLRVAVPGRISAYIRDYDLVFEAMEPLFEEYGGRLTLDLVGRPAGQHEGPMGRVEELRARGFDVDYRTEWISFEAFARSLRRADLVLNPVHVHRQIRHPLRTDQETGRKNGTGPLFDSIRYARPLLLPATFPHDPMIERFSRTFSSVDDLRGTLRTLIDDNTELHEFQTEAADAATEYDLDSQGQRFDAIVDNLLGPVG